jgi:hypothetical protein
MKTLKLTFIAIASLLIINSAQAQLIGGKKNSAGNGQAELDAEAAFNKGVQDGKLAARKRLVPYKYDGTKSTRFNYKTFTHAKEVEVLTIENTDYKFCFDGNMIKSDNITVEIYDKPMEAKGRILLFKKENVGPGEFEVNLEEMNEVFRSQKIASVPESDTPEYANKIKLYKSMRLKKVYVNYVIPAVEREVTEAGENGNIDQTTVIQFSAIVLAVGYKYM